MYDMPQFKYIFSMKRGAMYERFFMRLICESAKLNDGGRVYILRGKSVTISDLAMLTATSENIACEALSLFVQAGFIRRESDGGIVIENWSSYFGDIDGGDKEASDGDEEKNALVREAELIRERNREAQRRFREKHRKDKSNRESDTGAEKTAENDANLSNECVILRNITDNSEENYSSITSPKNIFIEENRIEESRIEENRIEKNKEEKKENNNFSQSVCVKTSGSPAHTSDGEEEKNASLPLASHAPEEKKGYGVFNNVFLSDRELDTLSGKYRDVLSAAIDQLSTKMESEGVTYKSHYATVIRFAETEEANRRRMIAGGGYRNNKGSGTQPHASGGYGALPPQDGSHLGTYSNNNSSAGCKGISGGSFDTKRRYSDFDPDEAFRLALERSAKEFGG